MNDTDLQPKETEVQYRKRLRNEYGLGLNQAAEVARRAILRRKISQIDESTHIGHLKECMLALLDEIR